MKKGFTLVEVLAVIAILAILMIIIIPPVLMNVESTRQESYKFLMKNIEQQTQLYIRNNKDSITGIHEIGGTVFITFQDLADKGNLKAPVIDPRTDAEIDLNTEISIYVRSQNKYDVIIGDLLYME